MGAEQNAPTDTRNGGNFDHVEVESAKVEADEGKGDFHSPDRYDFASARKFDD